MTDPVLEVRDLHVWFDLPDGADPVHAVRGVSLAVDPGDRFGLVGESGCGKSTTLLAAMGLLPATARVAGEVLLDGRPLWDAQGNIDRSRLWTTVAMIFQGAMNTLNPVRTIGSQLVEVMGHHGVAHGAAARGRAGDLLELVGIGSRNLDRHPHQLSGGMRQRVGIAMALACEPAVLLADEPTTALDVMVQAQILDLLVRLGDELGLALVLVTHDLPMVAQACTRAGVMYAGSVVETGPMAELYHHPRHPYTAALFAATPSLRHPANGQSIPGAPPRLDRALVGCSFADRCAYAEPGCRTTTPPLREVTAAHHYICHRPAALAVSP